MKYGVVKNNKILFKYAFKEDQSEALAAVKNSVAMPLEETEGKGAVRFVLQADKIVMQYDKVEEFLVKFDNDPAVEISDSIRKFLEKHFADAAEKSKRQGVFATIWRIKNHEWKRVRRLVWDRWDAYIGEVLSARFMFDDDGDNTGVSINDLILHSFLGDWPIQAKNGKHVLTAQEIAAAKDDLKSSLLIQRNIIRAKCLPANEASATRLRCLESTADWVVEGKGLG